MQNKLLSMERYIIESIKEFILVIETKWLILIPSFVGVTLSSLAGYHIKRTYDRSGIISLLLFISGLWIGLNITDINVLTAILISFLLTIPSALLLLYLRIENFPRIILAYTAFVAITYLYGAYYYREAKGEEVVYHLIGQAIFWGLAFYNFKKEEEEEMKEEERRERYRRVLTSSYESPLILPPSVGVVKKYSEEERDKELYWLIMQDIIDKRVDNETFYAIERIKDPKLREELLKEAYDVKIEIEKEKAYEEGEMDGYMDGYSSGYSDGFASGYAAGS